MMAYRVFPIFLCFSVLCSCSDYPIYESSSKGTVIGRNYSLFDSISVIELNIAAVQTKSSVPTKVLDTLEVEHDNPIITLESINSVSGGMEYNNQQTKPVLKLPHIETVPKYIDSLTFISGKMNYSSQPTTSVLKLPYEKTVPKYLSSLEVNGNAIVLFPTYRYSVSDERDGGGGIGFAYDNDFQRHNVSKSIHVAIYREGQLIYSDNAVRFEQIRIKKGEKMNHVFSREVADTLLNNALREYMERLE